MKEIQIWRPIQFKDIWLTCDTSTFDIIAPSWENKRKAIKTDSQEFTEFINQMKRRHAIETGIIERLYDLKHGITETFVKEGFIETYLQHGDTNVSEKVLLDFLEDHLNALDFVFSYVKKDRCLSKSFIRELHQLLTRTQKNTIAVDQFGNIAEIELLRGEFKKLPNNPKRNNGTKYIYCPPEQVESQIDEMLKIYNENLKSIHPIIKTAWFHHAFTQIHPFQDGNGRMARLLASLILIKNNLFPFTINRENKLEYITALEEADNNNPQKLIDIFCTNQKKLIESILNYDFYIKLSNSPLKEILSVFDKKVKIFKQKQLDQRVKRNKETRNKIYEYCKEKLDMFCLDIKKNLTTQMIDIFTEYGKFNSPRYRNYWYMEQLIEYAKKHNYYYNKQLPRAWMKLGIKIDEHQQYQLIINIHHYGFDDSTIAIGAFIESIYRKNSDNKKHKGMRKGKKNDFIYNMPLEIMPYTISLDVDIKNHKNSIQKYIYDLITVSFAKIINEIS